MATLDYRDININFEIDLNIDIGIHYEKTSVKIIFENVVFSSARLLIQDCSEHWCAHCHDFESLFALDINGEWYLQTPSGYQLTYQKIYEN